MILLLPELMNYYLVKRKNVEMGKVWDLQFFSCHTSPFTIFDFLKVTVITVKYRFNDSRFNIKSRFRVQNLVTKKEFHIKKSQFSLKSQFKK